jgi:hypothetical protein
MSNLIT